MWLKCKHDYILFHKWPHYIKSLYLFSTLNVSYFIITPMLIVIVCFISSETAWPYTDHFSCQSNKLIKHMWLPISVYKTRSYNKLHNEWIIIIINLIDWLCHIIYIKPLEWNTEYSLQWNAFKKKHTKSAHSINTLYPHTYEKTVCPTFRLV